jgi:O-acetyl-ADP-ribose deacetylase (regulator of RNase III)
VLHELSAGAYGWPLEDALGQAFAALRSAETAVEEARLVLFGASTFATAQRVFGD